MTKSKPKKSLLDLSLEAAIKLASESRWQDISFREIADEAGLHLTDLYGVTDKAKLVSALEPWADKAMSAEKADISETPRERLFDAIMRRFEHMETERSGVLSMIQARDRTPRGIAKLVIARRKTADWAMTAGSVDTGDALRMGAMRIGLIRIIARTETAWKSDDAGDYARTMATLDAGLVEMEERLGQFSKFRSRFRSGSGSSEATSSPHEGHQEEMSEA
ncbi:MAG: hypothetical protein AAFV54_03330 [Pseudomonadota bacterium]